MVKNCQREGGRGQKSWKFVDVLNGWSLSQYLSWLVKAHLEVSVMTEKSIQISTNLAISRSHCHYNYIFNSSKNQKSQKRFLIKSRPFKTKSSMLGCFQYCCECIEFWPNHHFSGKGNLSICIFRPLSLFFFFNFSHSAMSEILHKILNSICYQSGGKFK